MKNATLPCTKDQLYLIAKISWLTCHKYLNYFTHYNKVYSEAFVAKCELEIDVAQKELDTGVLRSIGIEELSAKKQADELNLNRLKRLHQAAKIVFKHNPQVANQFNFDHIMAIVTSI